MAKTVIGSVMVDLGLNTARFDSDISRARKTARTFEAQFKASFSNVRGFVNGMFPSFGKLAAMIGAVAGPAALGLLIATSMQSVDALAKTSDAIGITTQDLATLHHAGELAGVGVEQMNQSLRRMVLSTDAASKGAKQQSDAFRQLNINVDQFKNLGAAEQMSVLADRIGTLKTQAEKVAVATALFGKEGVNMLNVLQGGSKEFRATAHEAEQLGLAVSRFDAAKIEQANDSVSRVKAGFQGLGNTIAIAVSPVISALGEKFIESMKANNGFKDAVNSGMRFVVKAVAFAGDAIRGLKLVWDGVTVAVASAINAQIELVRKQLNFVADAINSVTGKDIQFTFINDLADSFSVTVDGMREKLVKDLNAPLPSDAVTKFYDDAMAKADEFAAHAVENKTKESMLGLVTDEDMELVVSQQQQRLEFEKRYQKELSDIANNAAYERYKFEQMTAVQKTSMILDQGVQMTQGVATTSKRMFELNKKLALAQAIVALPSAVLQSFENGGGYPWGLIPAGLMLVTGLAQINAIKKASFGAGSSAPSLAGRGGGGSTVNTVDVGQSRQPLSTGSIGREQKPVQRQVNITVNGPVDRQYLREALLPIIGEEINENDVVFMNSDSAQARELRRS